MPKTPRQGQSSRLLGITPGAVDLHFHGAFGIDLMSATPAGLDELSRKLAQSGVSAFLATTLSVPRSDLEKAVTRLGAWIRAGRFPGARPLGIHLEGPFIHPGACGAHAPGCIRDLSFTELDTLWEKSLKTLKILTVAPERLGAAKLGTLAAWAKKRGVSLSLGHSRATEAQAEDAFKKGFKGVTHAWNALPFHQRSPGALGAALGRPGVYLEIILDGVHVHPTVVRWTRAVHGKKICFVSDCVPAAQTQGWRTFGNLKIHFENGACRLRDGSLAGGGILLPEAYRRWLEAEAQGDPAKARALFKDSAHSLAREPLSTLGVSKPLGRLRWVMEPRGGIRFFRVDSG